MSTEEAIQVNWIKTKEIFHSFVVIQKLSKSPDVRFCYTSKNAFIADKQKMVATNGTAVLSRRSIGSFAFNPRTAREGRTEQDRKNGSTKLISNPSTESLVKNICIFYHVSYIGMSFNLFYT